MDVLARARAWLASPTHLTSRRRLVAAVLVAVIVGCAVHALRPPPAPTRVVWVAARDLPGGAPLTGGDVTARHMAMPDVPTGALPAAEPVVGRMLAAPMRRGEPLTDVRLLSPALLSAIGAPGADAVPVRVADGPAALALVHAGDRIDVIAASDPDAAAQSTGGVVVHDVRVLATPARDSSDAADDSGLLIVAATRRQAAVLSQAAVTSRLSISVRRPA
jgi:Flp pilus assembly protein CpaB